MKFLAIGYIIAVMAVFGPRSTVGGRQTAGATMATWTLIASIAYAGFILGRV